MRTAIGYPAHAVTAYREYQNRHLVRLTDWRATCGASGVAVGWARTAFKDPARARRGELCPACWPQGHTTRHDPPRLLCPGRGTSGPDPV